LVEQAVIEHGVCPKAASYEYTVLVQVRN